ncbi:MAG TPA: hypothetical protein VG899_03200, partial [Mycobacteriales bacterium]|nr:hypothetical protein [Mycobacteriales bacterium]
LGRELEASADVSSGAIGEVLRGARSYDTLDHPQEQAIVRATWLERIEQLHRDLDMRKVLAGRPYAELDESGNVVIRNG